jgi:hypothetical protein
MAVPARAEQTMERVATTAVLACIDFLFKRFMDGLNMNRPEFPGDFFAWIPQATLA